MKKKTFLFIAMLLFITAISVFAQDLLNADTTGFSEVSTGNAPPPANTNLRELTPMSSWEFTLSLVVLGFGLIIILIEILLIFLNRISSEQVVRFVIITLIITSALFLITAGYDNNQIAPAMGLLGTIAGYLLGRNQDDKKDEKKIEKNKPKNE